MWTSAVDIANGALSLLGEERITSFSDPTNRAVLASHYYDQARREVLAAFPWPFSLRRVKLDQQLATGPVHSYTYAFQLPSDLLRIWRVSDVDEKMGEPDATVRWTREEDRLLTDVAAAYVTYTFDATEVVKMDPLFVEALEVKLAMRMSRGITASSTDQQFLDQLYEKTMMQARHLASLEGGPITVIDQYMHTYRY